jgi:hypothetical protein
MGIHRPAWRPRLVEQNAVDEPQAARRNTAVSWPPDVRSYRTVATLGVSLREIEATGTSNTSSTRPGDLLRNGKGERVSNSSIPPYGA